MQRVEREVEPAERAQRVPRARSRKEDEVSAGHVRVDLAHALPLALVHHQLPKHLLLGAVVAVPANKTGSHHILAQKK